MSVDESKVLGAARRGRAGQIEVIDGPRLEAFNPSKLGAALAQEIARAGERGWPKISIHLDIADAAQLAAYLKRR